MAVVSMMRMQGDPDDLLERLQKHVVPVGQRLAPGHGGLANVVARTDDGVLVVNLWETDEGRHAMAEEPDVRAALQAAGLGPPAFEGYEIVWMTVRPEAVR